ncbi:hypothetical protein HPB50_020627 [Hyalomma asiaticum]|uniref:Uncharacterized protein n=1 Tax=Hyalomma asiaticum TaxID=266040 RepID=A0ACB7SCL0_HYAAI|nr:hypothetical protein HPB50_020627 [Hyalomma asiaticum]
MTLDLFWQECFRLFFFRVLRKAERVLNAVALTGADDAARMRSRLAFAYTAGLAFGSMSALFSLLGQLADALGPGTAGIFGGTPRHLAAAAITSAAFRYAIQPSVYHSSDGAKKKRCIQILGIST